MLRFPTFVHNQELLKLFQVGLAGIPVHGLGLLTGLLVALDRMVLLDILVAAVDHLVVLEVLGEEVVDVGQNIDVGRIELLVRLPRDDTLVGDAEDAIWGDVDLQIGC